MYYILHCCGYFKSIFPDVVELGADAVHPIQVMNNPAELKSLYGDKICFCGDFDNVGIIDREDATEVEVRREARRVIKELTPGGVFWCGGHFSVVSRRAYMDELMKFIRPQFEKLYKGMPFWSRAQFCLNRDKMVLKYSRPHKNGRLKITLKETLFLSSYFRIKTAR